MSKSITVNHAPLEQQSVTAEKKSLANEHFVTFMLGFTVVLVIMNTMMFNLALPKVAEQFSLATSTASWIVTGYSIVFAISSITYSRLSDILPIRALFIAALLSIGGGSLIGLFSDGFGVLLVAKTYSSVRCRCNPFTRYCAANSLYPIITPWQSNVDHAGCNISWPRTWPRNRRFCRAIFGLAFPIYHYRHHLAARSYFPADAAY